VGGIQAFSNVDTANPIDVENGQTTAFALTHAAPSVTTSVANAMLVTAHTLESASTWSPPSGMTEGFEARNLNIPTGQGQSIAASYVLQAAAGASGVKTATAGSDADDGNAHILALRPASAEPKLYFVHVDHLNTPRLVANAAGQTVWQWDQLEPFGNNPPDQNPSGLGVYDLPLRLPGQTYDVETGLHYNYYRDYDPSLGIYKQSDPIGLEAGLNTYAYVEANPLDDIDPEGLSSLGLCANPANAAVCAAAGIGAASSLATNLAVQVAQTGSMECVDWTQALASAATGAVLGALSGGIGGNALQTYKNVRALKRLAASRGLTYKPPVNPGPFAYTQTYVGNGQTLLIKTQPAVITKGSMSQVPRFSWQIGGSRRNPVFQNPFTGQVGNSVYLRHIPLNTGFTTSTAIGYGAATGMAGGAATNLLLNQ
jgi:RHS repeat-associated protein